MLIPVKSMLQMHLDTVNINLWHIAAAVLMSSCICLYVLLQPPLDLSLALAAAMSPGIIHQQNTGSWQCQHSQ